MKSIRLTFPFSFPFLDKSGIQTQLKYCMFYLIDKARKRNQLLHSTIGNAISWDLESNPMSNLANQMGPKQYEFPELLPLHSLCD